MSELPDSNDGAATDITNLDNSVDGQRVTIVGVANTFDPTVRDNGSVPAGNFLLANNADRVGDAADTLTVIHFSGIWFEVARSAN